MSDLQSEEERDILVELITPAGASASVFTAVFSKLQYSDVVASGMETVDCDLVLNLTSMSREPRDQE